MQPIIYTNMKTGEKKVFSNKLNVSVSGDDWKLGDHKVSLPKKRGPKPKSVDAPLSEPAPPPLFDDKPKSE